MGKREIEKYCRIMCNEQDSFAFETINKRVPKIIEDVISQNQFSSKINDHLECLLNEVRTGTIRNFVVTNGEQIVWDHFVESYKGKTWAETDFYFMEAYLYRRIIEITGFFKSNSDTSCDPFFLIKTEDLQSQGELVSQYSTRFYQNIDTGKPIGETLRELLLFSLWGNKSDLSLLTTPRDAMETSSGALFLDEQLLIDQSAQIVSFIEAGLNTIDIILDNAGVELFSDLMMAVYLLDQDICQNIRLHAKLHPTFVSDATISDIHFLVGYLSNSKTNECRKFGFRLKQLMDHNSIEISNHSFWNYPLHFYDMPVDLKDILDTGDLIVLKGDANYRRLLGDRRLPITSKTDALADYFSVNLLILRTIKSEVLTGIDGDKAAALDATVSGWRYNGHYGTIQWIEE